MPQDLISIFVPKRWFCKQAFPRNHAASATNTISPRRTNDISGTTTSHTVASNNPVLCTPKLLQSITLLLPMQHWCNHHPTQIPSST
mmetsp:Transcript_1326/g.1381  ORF Transcript_1326/g.1381 Transcript_1326/m.1381 type:complete len:87 (-) Transcript_1326:2581-2841(-)